MSVLFQTSKLKEQIQKVRDVLTKKDTETAESIKAVTDELQKASLKLFEMAYRKVTC
jgi:molecular chaperone DnaK